MNGKERRHPAVYDGMILVPFSPEALLSGVGRQLMPDECLWYRRVFDNPLPKEGGRLILHFGAVDQVAEVYVNGKWYLCDPSSNQDTFGNHEAWSHMDTFNGRYRELPF
jgi:hypothetical protein